MHLLEKELRSFSAAHRLVKGYEGKCKHLHGHNYRVLVTLACEQLDEYGFVMDFSEVKRLLSHWVQNHWDHCTLVAECDQPLLEFLQAEQMKHFIIPGNVNTTVEVLAEFLFARFTELLHQQAAAGIQLIEVKMYETSESAAACRGELGIEH